MSRKSRRKFSSDFKVKVAIEALLKRETLESMRSKYDLHPNQISSWKKQFKEDGSKVFETENHSVALKEKEHLISELYWQIGELKVDNDRLKKASIIPLEERRSMVEVSSNDLSIVRRSKL